MQRKTQSASKPAAAKKPVAKKPTTQSVTDPSSRLAALLRREGLAALRVKKAQQDLKDIQQEIQEMWEARKTQAEELLGDSAGTENS